MDGEKMSEGEERNNLGVRALYSMSKDLEFFIRYTRRC